MCYQRTKNFDKLSFLYLITGNTDKLRAKSIAHFVYARDTADERSSANIVRVEARRLRRALEEYYGDQGRSDPVRVYIDNRSRRDRSRAVARFVRSLSRIIRGIEITIVNDRRKANFTVYVVDRRAYKDVVRKEIARLDGDITHFVPPAVKRAVLSKYGKL